MPAPDRVPSPAAPPALEAEPAAKAEQSAGITRRQLREWLNRGPASLLQLVELSPYRNERGRFVGFQVASLHAPLTSGRTGLRVGDRITTVNGRRLITPADLAVVWKNADAREDIVVELLREGKTLTLEWPIVEDHED